MRKSKNENENKNENERKRKRKWKQNEKKDETYLSNRIANRISRSIRSKEDEPKNEKTKELGTVSQNENEKEKKRKKKYLSPFWSEKMSLKRRRKNQEWLVVGTKMKKKKKSTF